MPYHDKAVSPLPDVGPGGTGGTYGGEGDVIESITIDAQGRVTSVTAIDISSDLPNTGPGAGAYPLSTNDSITLDAKGRVTAITAVVRTISAGAGLSGGGTLAADFSIGMPNTGPGAGVIGGGGSFIESITLDAQGRVTAAATGTFPSVGPGAGTYTWADGESIGLDAQGRVTALTTSTRQKLGGTAYAASSDAAIVLGSGWGNTASVDQTSGVDSALTFRVTAGGTGIAASPTIVITYKDGTWTNVPIVQVSQSGASDQLLPVTWTVTATAVTITWNGTPAAGQTFTFTVTTLGLQ